MHVLNSSFEKGEQFYGNFRHVVKSLLKELLLGFLIKVENCIFKNILKIKDAGVSHLVYKI